MADSEHTKPVFRDALFRQKRKRDTYRIVEPPRLEAPIADTHAHLQLQPDPALALAQCAVHHVSFLCTIVDVFEDGSTTFDCLDSWQRQARAEITTLVDDGESASRFTVPQVRIAVGCHPHNAKYYDDAFEAQLRERLSDARVCAVGEIGLDYHYDFSPRDQQREVFRRQLRIAKACGLPVVLHIREAHDEALAIMRDEGFPQAGTLLHCFNLDWKTLEPWVEAGCYVAFGGALTFKKADEVRDAAAHVPMDRLLTETDAPYMTPEPMRGMPCRPDHVMFTAACLAQVRESAPGQARQAFLDQLMDNARKLLDRPATVWQQTAAEGT